MISMTGQVFGGCASAIGIGMAAYSIKSTVAKASIEQRNLSTGEKVMCLVNGGLISLAICNGGCSFWLGRKATQITEHLLSFGPTQPGYIRRIIHIQTFALRKVADWVKNLMLATFSMSRAITATGGANISHPKILFVLATADVALSSSAVGVHGLGLGSEHLIAVLQKGSSFCGRATLGVPALIRLLVRIVGNNQQGDELVEGNGDGIVAVLQEEHDGINDLFNRLTEVVVLWDLLDYELTEIPEEYFGDIIFAMFVCPFTNRPIRYIAQLNDQRAIYFEKAALQERFNPGEWVEEPEAQRIIDERIAEIQNELTTLAIRLIQEKLNSGVRQCPITGMDVQHPGGLKGNPTVYELESLRQMVEERRPIPFDVYDGPRVLRDVIDLSFE